MSKIVKKVVSQYSKDDVTKVYKKRVFIYIRVSTTEQAEEGYSLGEQEERLKKYADAMDWEVVKIYSDPGYSGGNMERPALQQMLKEIENGNGDIVLVDKLDRLSRSQFDTLYMIQKIFNEYDVAFVSRAEAFDTSTSFGRAMVGILSVFAELERERIKERMAEGKLGRAKEGKFHGGNAVTYGYVYNPENDLLEVDEYEAMITKEIFEMIADRVPFNKIASIMNEKGYKTKNKKEWSDTVIRQMAVNKTYIGKILYKGEYYDAEHTHIISDELFNRVQGIMKERNTANERYKPGKKYSSPLGGFIWCSHCNAKYSWRKYKPRKDGSFTAKYVCYSVSKCDKKLVKDPNCNNRQYIDKELEDAIYTEVLKLKSDPAYIDKVKQSIDPSIKIDLISRQIEDINKQISRYMDFYALEEMKMDEVKVKITPLQKERNLLQDELALLEHEKPSSEREDIIHLVDIFQEKLLEGDSASIHDALIELIDYIEIDNEKVMIHWNF